MAFTMESAIAILSVITCAASILGLIYQYFDKSHTVLILIFIGTAGFSFYLLFFPDNKIITNVSSKIRHYSIASKGDVIVQQRSFSFSGNGPYSIQFPQPYMEKPEKVYILNPNGYAEIQVPKVLKVTKHYFDVGRRGSSMFELTPQFLQQYKWIAEGKPLKEKH